MSGPVLSDQFDPAAFLEDYWQQKPCLLPGLITDFHDPISPDELAGLACEDGAEARLVSRTEQTWRARFGPFQESDFQSLPNERWTLLVQAVDLWLPEVAALGQLFGFIPAWRREDVMVSFAAEGGGVGPHFDHYDVLLVQGMGRRRWRIGSRCSSESALADNPELRLLKDFQATEEHELGPGDVLYIPPGVSHWGEALEDSLCYSIGFRAPSASDAILGYGELLAARQDEAKRYTDPPAGFGQPGEISQDVINQLQVLVMDEFPGSNPDDLLRWFGCHVTAARDASLITPPERDLAALLPGQVLRPHPLTRLAWARTRDDNPLLFCNGQHYPVPVAAIDVLPQLCATSPITVAGNWGELSEVLLDLVNSGALAVAAGPA